MLALIQILVAEPLWTEDAYQVVRADFYSQAGTRHRTHASWRIHGARLVQTFRPLVHGIQNGLIRHLPQPRSVLSPDRFA
jgi:hypothetical protein